MEDVVNAIQCYKQKYVDLTQPDAELDQLLSPSPTKASNNNSPLSASQVYDRYTTLQNENAYLKTIVEIMELDLRNKENGVEVYPSMDEKLDLDIKACQVENELNESRQQLEVRKRELKEAVKIAVGGRRGMAQAKLEFKEQIEKVFKAAGIKEALENVKTCSEEEIKVLLESDQDVVVLKAVLDRVKGEEEELAKEERRIAEKVDQCDREYNAIPDDIEELERELKQLKESVAKNDGNSELVRRKSEEKETALLMKQVLSNLTDFPKGSATKQVVCL